MAISTLLVSGFKSGVKYISGILETEKHDNIFGFITSLLYNKLLRGLDVVPKYLIV